METWRFVLGSDSYKISDHGRVWSIKKQKIVEPLETRTGYLQVAVGRSRPVHHLVLEAFVEPRPTRTAETRHLDGDPANNRPENLAWGDRLANAADKRDHGTHNNTKRQTCRRRGHDLVGPNLDQRDLEIGKRRCRACRLGFVAMTNARRRGTFYDRDVIADQLYAWLMGDGPDPRHDQALRKLAELDAPLEHEVRDGRLATATPNARRMVLNAMRPGETIAPTELRKRLANEGHELLDTTIQQALTRAVRCNDLVKVARGRYRLPVAAAEAAAEAS